MFSPPVLRWEDLLSGIMAAWSASTSHKVLLLWEQQMSWGLSVRLGCRKLFITAIRKGSKRMRVHAIPLPVPVDPFIPDYHLDVMLKITRQNQASNWSAPEGCAISRPPSLQTDWFSLALKKADIFELDERKNRCVILINSDPGTRIDLWEFPASVCGPAHVWGHTFLLAASQ